MTAADVSDAEVATMIRISKHLLLIWMIPASIGLGVGMIFLKEIVAHYAQ